MFFELCSIVAKLQAVDQLLRYGGASFRTSDLYGNMTSIAIAKKLIKVRLLKNEENTDFL